MHGRIVALEVYRREGRCDALVVGAHVDAIDWSGLAEAVVWLNQQDVLAPEA